MKSSRPVLVVILSVVIGVAVALIISHTPLSGTYFGGYIVGCLVCLSSQLFQNILTN